MDVDSQLNSETLTVLLVCDTPIILPQKKVDSPRTAG